MSVRTTVTIEDDAAAIAREYASESGESLGKAITLLIRAGSRALQEDVEYPGDFQPAPYRPDGPVITSDLVRKLDDETW